MDAFGKAAYVVDAVPWRQMIHIFADGVVGETEIGVDQVLHVLDAARITGFVQFHPDAVTYHVIQHDEIIFTLFAAFHAVLHLVVARFVMTVDILSDAEEVPLRGSQLACVKFIRMLISAVCQGVYLFGRHIGEVEAQERGDFFFWDAVSVVCAGQPEQIVVAVAFFVLVFVIVVVKEESKQGAAFALGIRDVVRRLFAPGGICRCCGSLFPSGSFLFLLSERTVEVDNQKLRGGIQVGVFIMGQIADACHVFARFVDVRLAKLLVECRNLVVSVGMVVAYFFGRLRQGAVGQAGLYG